MATKSYSKHKEYKEFKSSGNVPYTDEQFDMLKSELMPRAKADGVSNGHREYHYEYKEEKHPSGKFDKKDMHTVEEYTVPPKNKPKSKESSSYYYERAERELPSFNASTNRSINYESNTTHSPGGYNSDVADSSSFDYRKGGTMSSRKEERVESSSWRVSPPPPPTVTKGTEMRQEMYREEKIGGYTSDTAENGYDYKRSTVSKAPSSGYSSLRKEEHMESSSWATPAPVITKAAEMRQEMYREEKHESRIVPSQVSPAIPQPVPLPVCFNCHQSNVQQTNIHQSNSTLSRSSTPMNKVTTTVKTYTYEVPADQNPTAVPIPTTATTERHYLSATDKSSSKLTQSIPPPSPSLGCQFCSHCNSRITTTVHQSAAPAPAPLTTHHYQMTTNDLRDERIVYPKPANEIKLLPDTTGPYGPTTYKFSETTYSAQNTTERVAAPSPFPRPHTPSPSTQQPPKVLDDLMADFPEARFPTQPDGVYQRKVAISHESSMTKENLKAAPPVGTTKNVAGPPVYYPPNHKPFAVKEGEKSSAMMAGGAYASGKGMYEYEAGSKSKEKHTEKKTAVPVCLPLCCAMPCVIM